jgi:hypothetical protein
MALVADAGEARWCALSLVPYWILRGFVRPLPGFNGY